MSSLDKKNGEAAIGDDPDIPLTGSGESLIVGDNSERDDLPKLQDRSIPPIHRRRTDRMVAGVAGGLADTLGVGEAFVRAAFVTLTTVMGLGLLVYLGLWLMTLDRVADAEERRRVSAQRGMGLLIGFAGVMIFLLALGLWPSNGLVITVWAVSFGAAFLTDRNLPNPLASLLDPAAARPGRIRLLFGIGLLMGGLAVFAANVGQFFTAGPVILAVALTGVGILVGFGPWVSRLAKDLGSERRERIRQEERAEMAAHLHDSVLQTLALIQRSDDPARMAMLARHQEGELRDWLYGTTPLEGVDLMSTALRQAASRIEESHQVPIDVVVVGDHSLTELTSPMIGAASEAMVNAAKHSGAGRVSLYFEADEDDVAVFVTDQGDGFDLANSAPGRGIANSITERMERAGGSAEIDSVPGEGTEVVLRMRTR